MRNAIFNSHLEVSLLLDGMLQYISFQSPLSILNYSILSYLIVKVDNKSIAWMYWTWWLKERSLSLKEHTTLSIKIRSEGRIPYKTIVTFTLLDDTSTDRIKASSLSLGTFEILQCTYLRDKFYRNWNYLSRLFVL